MARSSSRTSRCWGPSENASGTGTTASLLSVRSRTRWSTVSAPGGSPGGSVTPSSWPKRPLGHARSCGQGATSRPPCRESSHPRRNGTFERSAGPGQIMLSWRANQDGHRNKECYAAEDHRHGPRPTQGTRFAGTSFVPVADLAGWPPLPRRWAVRGVTFRGRTG